MIGFFLFMFFVFDFSCFFIFLFSLPSFLLILFVYYSNQFGYNSLFTQLLGVSLLNIKPLNSKDLQAKNVIFVSMIDNIMIRSQMKNKHPYMLKFEPYIEKNSIGDGKNDYVIVPNMFENDGLYMNLEDRPQATKRMLTLPSNVKPIDTFFSNIIKYTKKDADYESKPNFLNYIYETLESKKLFFLPHSVFLNESLWSKSSKNLSFEVSNYPLKSTVKSFHIDSVNAKKSPTMQKCFNRVLASSTNF